MVLKQALKIAPKKSVLEAVKEKIPKPLDYTDDVIVVLIVLGYGYGQMTGIPVFPEWSLVAAIGYALGKDLNTR